MDKGRVRTAVKVNSIQRDGEREGEGSERQEDGEKRGMRTNPEKSEREIMDAERSLPLP